MTTFNSLAAIASAALLSFSSLPQRVHSVNVANFIRFDGCTAVGVYSPSAAPTSSPSVAPSAAPTLSLAPSVAPSAAPSAAPTLSLAPSVAPSAAPSAAPTLSLAPSVAPSAAPSAAPTVSVAPSAAPTTGTPTASPTSSPTFDEDTQKGITQTIDSFDSSTAAYAAADFCSRGTTSLIYKSSTLNDATGAFQLNFQLDAYFTTDACVLSAVEKIKSSKAALGEQWENHFNVGHWTGVTVNCDTAVMRDASTVKNVIFAPVTDSAPAHSSKAFVLFSITAVVATALAFAM